MRLMDKLVSCFLFWAHSQCHCFTSQTDFRPEDERLCGGGEGQIRVSRIQLCVSEEWSVQTCSSKVQCWTWTLRHKVRLCFHCKLTWWRWCTEDEDEMFCWKSYIYDVHLVQKLRWSWSDFFIWHLRTFTSELQNIYINLLRRWNGCKYYNYSKCEWICLRCVQIM